MKLRTVLAASLALIAVNVSAQTTPLTDPLVDEHEIIITCEYTSESKRPDQKVLESKAEEKAMNGIYHYKLRLPKGYMADPTKSWPVMFIAAPGGKAGMGNMGAYLKEHGIIMVMLQESKNGPFAPMLGNFLAAHDDLVQRVRVLEGQKYCTGWSGAALGSSTFILARPGFAGAILQGHGPNDVDAIKRNPKLHIAMLVGETDTAFPLLEPAKRAMPASRFLGMVFPGGHMWAPTEYFNKAMDWLTAKATAAAAAPAQPGSLLPGNGAAAATPRSSTMDAPRAAVTPPPRQSLLPPKATPAPPAAKSNEL